MWSSQNLTPLKVPYISAVKGALMLISIVIAAAASAATAPPINLICIGTALKDERVGTTLDFLAGNTRTERVGTQDTIRFTIEAGSTGTARLPARLQSPYKEANQDGSFNLMKVVQTDNEITGQIRLHANYKPKFRLDRLSGVVTVSGVLGEFSGTCERFDPATVERKF
jgi:hypothetical protein